MRGLGPRRIGRQQPRESGGLLKLHTMTSRTEFRLSAPELKAGVFSLDHLWGSALTVTLPNTLLRYILWEH